MHDVHIHFLHGSECGYSREFFDGYVKKAVEMGLEEIYLLEHAHHFREFEGVYAPCIEFNSAQRKWLTADLRGSVEDYLTFIESVTWELTIKVKFGLEVCYIPETSGKLANILGQYNFDFLTGGVHSIDGWLFDDPGQRELWRGVDVNKTYLRYYEILPELCESCLFGGLAHPDSIKCFGYRPTCDLTGQYQKLSDALNKNNMYTENNGGLKLRYNPDLELGLNPQLLAVLQQNNVDIRTASDAHQLSHVGAYIRELGAMLEKGFPKSSARLL
ncbi:MAG: PHP domain-containing protein [Defluviitaleaceae bacterium]|nr:PHP domain-containing protein [Defluviitaleaceae bacterium]